jgi:hypothetical protein
MQVQSPVGTFPLTVRRIRLRRDGLALDTSLGAWSSEVKLERSDARLLGAAISTLLLAFLVGRASARSTR